MFVFIINSKGLLFYSYVIFDSSNNNHEYISFYNCNCPGSYLRGGYCKYLNFNISFGINNLDHAGYNPFIYLVSRCIFKNLTYEYIICPSARTNGLINYCNFLNNNCSSLILYFGTGVNVDNCYFINNIDNICLKHFYEGANPGFSITNCFSTDIFKGDVIPINWIINFNNLTIIYNIYFICEAYRIESNYIMNYNFNFIILYINLFLRY